MYMYIRLPGKKFFIFLEWLGVFSWKKRVFSPCRFQWADTNTYIFTLPYSRLFRQMPAWKISFKKKLYFWNLFEEVTGDNSPFTIITNRKLSTKKCYWISLCVWLCLILLLHYTIIQLLTIAFTSVNK